MKRLILLRHAKSDWLSGARGDHDRPLNQRGEKDAPLIGEFLASSGLIPDLILSSDSKRTRQTVERLITRLPSQPDVTFSPDLYHASEDILLAAAARAPLGCQTLMLVAHNPGIHALAANLIDPSSGDQSDAKFLHANYPTAALSVFRIDITDWQEVAFHTAVLECYQTPKTIKKNRKETP
ncbi:MAG: histidine phosphatase family protein [Alphaproteobacteria bacterium]|nr:MAG: histidine phosphatase family protein [Alphaproteobacteria bacterium]